MEETGRHSVVTAIDFIKPPKWASVPLADVIRLGWRLDAAAHGIAVRYARETLDRCGWNIVNLLPGLAENVHQAPRFRRVYASAPGKKTEPFFLPSQIGDISPEEVKWIYPAAIRTDINALRARPGQTLLARSGTIGECIYTGKTHSGKIFSDDLIHITAKMAGYICAFIKTETGRALLASNNYGGVIQHIETTHVSDLPIPNPPLKLQKEIHDCIHEARRLLDDSNDLIDGAHALLAESLSLPELEKIRKSAPMFSRHAGVQNFSVAVDKLGSRLDASFHLPMVGEIVKRLNKKAARVATAAELSKKIVLPGRFKRIYVGEGRGVPFIGGKQIYQLDPSNKKYLSLKQHGKRVERELRLEKGMILVTCSGTVGRVCLVPKHWERYAASQHLIRIVPSSKDMGAYLYAWLSSQHARPLIKRFVYGAVVDEIHDNHVGRVPVPLLADIKAQEKIIKMVLLAQEKREKSHVLEHRAIEMVNSRVLKIAE